MPLKPNGKPRKTKGADDSAPSKKHAKKATKRAQVSVPLQQDSGAIDGETDYTGNEAVPTPKDDMVQKMNTMMAMILDLSQKIHASDVRQTERTASPSRESLDVSRRPKEDKMPDHPYS